MSNDVGNIIGKTIDATLNSATGVWNLFDQIRYRRNGLWPDPNILATGGTELIPGNGFKYHVFDSPGTFTVTQGGNGYLVLIGGGGGGQTGSPGEGGQAGGGAGGVIIAPIALSGITTVVIGSGGASGNGGFLVSPGQAGSNSTFGPNWVALGGGGASRSPAGGGSPGGIRDVIGTAGPLTQATNPAVPADSRTFGFGNLGGNGSSEPNFGGGGGGGAGGAGTTSTVPGSPAANGGSGLPTAPYPWLAGTPIFSPTSQFFAGGGGGVGRSNTTSNGGSGGGGPGVHAGAGGAGTVNTGSGGGGGQGGGGGAGGSGRSIIVYPFT